MPVYIKHFLILSVSLAFLAENELLAQVATQHPDLSGSWVRVSQKCEAKDDANGSLQITIDQREPNLLFTIESSVNGKMGELALAYKTTGEELHFTGLDGDDFRTKLHWRGNDLIFDTIESERGHEIQVQEVWTLQNHATQLLRIKKENSEREHSTCTSLFSQKRPPKDAGHKVKITLQTDRIAVEINGEPFTSLYMGMAANKPFLYPLRTASGKRVTRGFPIDPQPADPTDHPHQKGLWVGAEHLSNMDFWENDPSYHRPNMGRIVFKDILETHAEGDRGSFTMLSDWISEAGESVVAEKRRMTFYAEPADSRMFDVELELKAKREVTFQDHHDAVIGIRLAPAFDEKNGGRPVNAQGLAGETEVRGQRSEWVDWQTGLEGEQVGVALMDHPGNYSWPTRWHVRSMGLLVASPFAQRDYLPEAPENSKTLAQGETLHLRYRVLIHPKSLDVRAAYAQFASQALVAAMFP